MKTSELIGPALDWAVAKCEGFDSRNNCVVEYVNEQDSDDVLEFVCQADDEAHAMEQLYDAYPESAFISASWPKYEPSSDWSLAGAIIERERISIEPFKVGGRWLAFKFDTGNCEIACDTPLVAAMRCFLASKLGDEVDVPEELQ